MIVEGVFGSYKKGNANNVDKDPNELRAEKLAKVKKDTVKILENDFLQRCKEALKKDLEILRGHYDLDDYENQAYGFVMSRDLDKCAVRLVGKDEVEIGIPVQHIYYDYGFDGDIIIKYTEPMIGSYTKDLDKIFLLYTKLFESPEYGGRITRSLRKLLFEHFGCDKPVNIKFILDQESHPDYSKTIVGYAMHKYSTLESFIKFYFFNDGEGYHITTNYFDFIVTLQYMTTCITPEEAKSFRKYVTVTKDVRHVRGKLYDDEEKYLDNIRNILLYNTSKVNEGVFGNYKDLKNVSAEDKKREVRNKTAKIVKDAFKQKIKDSMISYYRSKEWNEVYGKLVLAKASPVMRRAMQITKDPDRNFRVELEGNKVTLVVGVTHIVHFGGVDKFTFSTTGIIKMTGDLRDYETLFLSNNEIKELCNEYFDGNYELKVKFSLLNNKTDDLSQPPMYREAVYDLPKYFWMKGLFSWFMEGECKFVFNMLTVIADNPNGSKNIQSFTEEDLEDMKKHVNVAMLIKIDTKDQQRYNEIFKMFGPLIRHQTLRKWWYMNEGVFGNYKKDNIIGKTSQERLQDAKNRTVSIVRNNAIDDLKVGLKEILVKMNDYFVHTSNPFSYAMMCIPEHGPSGVEHSEIIVQKKDWDDPEDKVTFVINMEPGNSGRYISTCDNSAMKSMITQFTYPREVMTRMAERFIKEDEEVFNSLCSFYDNKNPLKLIDVKFKFVADETQVDRLQFALIDFDKFEKEFLSMFTEFYVRARVMGSYIGYTNDINKIENITDENLKKFSKYFCCRVYTLEKTGYADHVTRELYDETIKRLRDAFEIKRSVNEGAFGSYKSMPNDDRVIKMTNIRKKTSKIVEKNITDNLKAAAFRIVDDAYYNDYAKDENWWSCGIYTPLLGEQNINAYSFEWNSNGKLVTTGKKQGFNIIDIQDYINIYLSQESGKTKITVTVPVCLPPRPVIKFTMGTIKVMDDDLSIIQDAIFGRCITPNKYGFQELCEEYFGEGNYDVDVRCINVQQCDLSGILLNILDYKLFYEKVVHHFYNDEYLIRPSTIIISTDIDVDTQERGKGIAKADDELLNKLSKHFKAKKHVSLKGRYSQLPPNSIPKELKVEQTYLKRKFAVFYEDPAKQREMMSFILPGVEEEDLQNYAATHINEAVFGSYKSMPNVDHDTRMSNIKKKTSQIIEKNMIDNLREPALKIVKDAFYNDYLYDNEHWSCAIYDPMIGYSDEDNLYNESFDTIQGYVNVYLSQEGGKTKITVTIPVCLSGPAIRFTMRTLDVMDDDLSTIKEEIYNRCMMPNQYGFHKLCEDYFGNGNYEVEIKCINIPNAEYPLSGVILNILDYDAFYQQVIHHFYNDEYLIRPSNVIIYTDKNIDTKEPGKGIVNADESLLNKIANHIKAKVHVLLKAENSSQMSIENLAKESRIAQVYLKRKFAMFYEDPKKQKEALLFTLPGVEEEDLQNYEATHMNESAFGNYRNGGSSKEERMKSIKKKTSKMIDDDYLNNTLHNIMKEAVEYVVDTDGAFEDALYGMHMRPDFGFVDNGDEKRKAVFNTNNEFEVEIIRGHGGVDEMNYIDVYIPVKYVSTLEIKEHYGIRNRVTNLWAALNNIGFTLLHKDDELRESLDEYFGKNKYTIRAFMKMHSYGRKDLTRVSIFEFIMTSAIDYYLDFMEHCFNGKHLVNTGVFTLLQDKGRDYDSTMSILKRFGKLFKTDMLILYHVEENVTSLDNIQYILSDNAYANTNANVRMFFTREAFNTKLPEISPQLKRTIFGSEDEYEKHIVKMLYNTDEYYSNDFNKSTEYDNEDSYYQSSTPKRFESVLFKYTRTGEVEKPCITTTTLY